MSKAPVARGEKVLEERLGLHKKESNNSAAPSRMR